MDSSTFAAPQQPLLPVTFQYRDFCRFVELLQWSLAHSAEMTRTYHRMLAVAPSEAAAECLEAMVRDETEHFRLFETIYTELKGAAPHIRLAESETAAYPEALNDAIKRERTAVKRYRDTYLLTPSPMVRDVYFMALCDEFEHISGLLLLLHQTLDEKRRP